MSDPVKEMKQMLDDTIRDKFVALREVEKLRARVAKLEKVREAAELLCPEIEEWASGAALKIDYSDIAQFTNEINELKYALKDCEEKDEG